MGKEQASGYYDSIFSKAGLYSGQLKSMPWFKVWMAASSYILEQSPEHVIDLGCGPGHMALLLMQQGYDGRYVGYDFSAKAIEIASESVEDEMFRFFLGDLKGFDLSSITPQGKTVYVACEFLEHVEWDLSLLETVPSGSTVIATVPNFDDAGHVRYFNTLSEVLSRYSSLISINGAKMVGRRHFVFSGTRH